MSQWIFRKIRTNTVLAWNRLGWRKLVSADPDPGFAPIWFEYMVSGSLTIIDLCCIAYSRNLHGYENNKQFIILFLSDSLFDSVTCSTAARTAEAGGRQRDRDRPGPASQRFHSDRDSTQRRVTLIAGANEDRALVPYQSEPGESRYSPLPANLSQGLIFAVIDPQPLVPCWIRNRSVPD